MKAEVYFYDIEAYRNSFVVTIKNKDQEDFKTFTIFSGDGVKTNDLKKIVDFFKNKNLWFTGYNNHTFDNQIINMIIKEEVALSCLTPREITESIYDFVVELITSGNYPTEYKYLNYYNSIDLMRIIQVGYNTKSLKLVAVNLKWYKIQDLPIPWKDDVDVGQMDELVKYNINDVEITEALYKKINDRIQLRATASAKYGVNLMEESDSGMANKILESMYERATGIRAQNFTKLKTERKKVALEGCISNKIKFQTEELQRFLNDIKRQSVNPSTEFERRVKINKTAYDIKTGGIHSVRDSEIIEEGDGYYLIDADVSSYYPYIMLNFRIKPHHLSPVFLSILRTIVEGRVEAKKRAKDQSLSQRERDQYKAEADTYKITVNSVFGKTGFEGSWFYDLKAMYSVTLNGQLFLLMLIEALELEGIEVVYANTDGITARVHKNQVKKYKKICHYWQQATGFSLDFERFTKMVMRDVNNYLVIKKGGDTKAKGVLDKSRHEDVMKGFNMPVVSLALHRYFVDGIPVAKTIREHEDWLDFCIAQKVGKKFWMEFHEIVDGNRVKTRIQRTNRFVAVVRRGGKLIKVKEEEKDGKKKRREYNMLKTEARSRRSQKNVQLVRLVNDYDGGKIEDIDYLFYERECNKIISQFRKPELTLFDQ